MGCSSGWGWASCRVSWLVYSSDGAQLAAVLGRQTVIQLRPGIWAGGVTFQMETQLNGLAYLPPAATPSWRSTGRAGPRCSTAAPASFACCPAATPTRGCSVCPAASAS